MDNTTLKAQIDSQITNETTVGGISPSDVGGNIKAVVDYVDQEVKTRIIKTTITEAQVLALFDTPITVLDGSASGIVKYPINVHVVRKAGNAYTLATSSFSIITDTGATVSGNLNPNPLTGTSEGYFAAAMSIQQNNAGISKNNLYKLKANSGNPTSGTGELDVYVTYIEITL